jgi:hypothetical protein
MPIVPHMPSYMADPAWALSEGARRGPFAYSRGGSEMTLWDHYTTPDGAQAHTQFDAAMVAQQVDTLPSILRGAPRTRVGRPGTHGSRAGFAWQDLPKDSLVVDVGGGVGSAALAVLRAHPHLRFLIQDLPGPIARGRKVRPHGRYPPYPSADR